MAYSGSVSGGFPANRAASSSVISVTWSKAFALRSIPTQLTKSVIRTNACPRVVFIAVPLGS